MSHEAERHVEGVRSGDRSRLARAITLVESSAPAQRSLAAEVLSALAPEAGRSLRVGITGIPGAGKSTLIDALGLHLTSAGHHVAVTAVDPSSRVSGGSLLADKTRMPRLAADPHAFIRPSPTGGALGGVARRTRETLSLLEAAGYDVIIVETTGVGQSETAVRSMVDFFLLLVVAGAGDVLQGLKKGIVEMADAVAVNKVDGDGLRRADAAKAHYQAALALVAPATEGWRTPVITVSGLTGDGIADLWDTIVRFRDAGRQSGAWERRRRAQERDWLHAIVEDELREWFYGHAEVRRLLPELEQAVLDGHIAPAQAARRLIDAARAD